MTKIPKVDEHGELIIPPTAVQKRSAVVAELYRVVTFRGRPMLLVTDPFDHFIPLRREHFDKIGYPVLGGVTRGQMGDTFAYLCNSSEDLTNSDHLILFGQKDDLAPNYRSIVWDMQTLSATAYQPESTIWRSPYAQLSPPAPDPAPQGDITRPKPDHQPERLEFIMQLAGGDEGLYDDMMQSMAPLVMARKPDGVIWWVGDGANGKSTLMDALYRVFPGQLSSITVKRLTDGRDTPSLNGTLANVVKESSEGRIDDTEIYKSIGTHENFRVHKFHSQDDVEIQGNLHHIFSGNSIPAFNDKGFSARRRTFIIPFNERFISDPTFEQKTFTSEFFGQLISEMCRYAVQLRKQGYRYKWSATTLGAKADYDTEANSAEEYAKDIISEGVVAFDSFNPVRMDYETWCADNGYVPLGVGNMRRALQSLGFERVSVRDDGHVNSQYRLPSFKAAELQVFGMGRPGLFTVSGFQPDEPEKPEPTTDDTIPESIVNGGW